jgi:hypothetical protein
MPFQTRKWIPIVALVLGCAAPGAFAREGTGIGVGIGVGEQLHAHALASFREARFSEAYGRFSGLADAGHAPAAAVALWMYLNGPLVFGKDWDCTQEQLTAWAQLARQPVPTMVGQTYPQPIQALRRRAR